MQIKNIYFKNNKNTIRCLRWCLKIIQKIYDNTCNNQYAFLTKHSYTKFDNSNVDDEYGGGGGEDDDDDDIDGDDNSNVNNNDDNNNINNNNINKYRQNLCFIPISSN